MVRRRRAHVGRAPALGETLMALLSLRRHSGVRSPRGLRAPRVEVAICAPGTAPFPSDRSAASLSLNKMVPRAGREGSSPCPPGCASRKGSRRRSPWHICHRPLQADDTSSCTSGLTGQCARCQPRSHTEASISSLVTAVTSVICPSPQNSNKNEPKCTYRSAV